MTDSSVSTTGVVRTTVTAGEDLLNGLRKWEIWGRLGWLEIRRRYRRTVIGPFWGAVSIAVFVFAMGGIGAGLFRRNTAEYLPFLASGLVVWVFISTAITESCLLFVASGHLFRQMRFDYSILAYALVWRGLVSFLHNFSVYLVVALFIAPEILTPAAFLALPGLLIIAANGVWVALLLGMFCLRFRDVQQFVTSILQLVLFATPIIWAPESLPRGRDALLVRLNPLYQVIEVVRAPLLGHVPSLENYATAAVITMLGWGITYKVFDRFRKRIAYWS